MALVAPAVTADASFRSSLRPQEPTLSDAKLDQLRGGFFNSDGFLVKFSFQNIVKIDGVLQQSLVIEIPEIQMPTFSFAGDKEAPSVSTLADQKKEGALEVVPQVVAPVSSRVQTLGSTAAASAPSGEAAHSSGPLPIFSQAAQAPAPAASASAPSEPVFLSYPSDSPAGPEQQVAVNCRLPEPDARPLPGPPTGLNQSMPKPSLAGIDKKPLTSAGAPEAEIHADVVAGSPAVNSQPDNGSKGSSAPLEQAAAGSGPSKAPSSQAAGEPLLNHTEKAGAMIAEEKRSGSSPDKKSGQPETGYSSNKLTTVSQTGSNNSISLNSLQNLQAVQTFIQNALNDKHIQHSQMLKIEFTRFPFYNGGLQSKINAQMMDMR